MKVESVEFAEKRWDSFAGWYTTYMERGSTKFYTAMLPFLELGADSVVLETACGGGNGIELLLSSTQATQIFGVDISAGMLDIARSRMGDRANIQQGDNQALPFEDSSFSHYISNLSLHIVPNPAKMLAEAFRVLRPGGVCAVSVLGTENSFIKLSHKLTAFSSKQAPDPEVRSHFHLNDSSKVLSLISEAGFTQPLHFSEIYQFPLKSPQAIADLFGSSPATKVLETSDPEHFQEAKALALREAEALILGEHRLFEQHGVVYIMRKP
jgi:ubiquinone/menaquinone biosynthesis C-methylase UbiE